MLKEIVENLNSERKELDERLKNLIWELGIMEVAEVLLKRINDKEVKKVADLLVDDMADMENDFPELYSIYKKHKYRKFLEEYYFNYADEVVLKVYFAELVFNALTNDEIKAHIEYMEDNLVDEY